MIWWRDRVRVEVGVGRSSIYWVSGGIVVSGGGMMVVGFWCFARRVLVVGCGKWWWGGSKSRHRQAGLVGKKRVKRSF